MRRTLIKSRLTLKVSAAVEKKINCALTKFDRFCSGSG